MPNSRILVGEIDAEYARLLSERLENLGYTVVAVVSTVKEVTAACESAEIDLLLVNLYLPDKTNGAPGAVEIQRRCDLPIIYLTDDAEAETLDRIIEYKPSGYLLKPFDDGKLRTIIELSIYRFQVKQRHKRHEHLLAATLASIGDGVITVDNERRVSFINQVAARLTGWRNEEASSRDLEEVFRIVDEETRRPAQISVDQLFEGEKTESSDRAILLARDGGERLIEDNAAPIRDEQGNLYGAVLVFRDITERRRGEEILRKTNQELRERDELLALAQRAARLAFTLSSSQPERSFLTPEWKELMGLSASPDNSLDKEFYQAIHPDDLGLISENRRRVLDGADSVSGEFRIRHPSDGIRWIYARSKKIAPLPDEDYRYVSVAIDITERKTAEEAMRRSEERFRVLIEQGSDMISICDRDGVFRFLSPSVKRVLGYEPEELIGTSLPDLASPDERSETIETLGQIADRPGVHPPREIRLRHKDGSWRDIDCTHTNLLDDPVVQGVIFNGRDVTERKLAEKRLRSSETSFRNVVESIDHGLIITDFEDKVIYTNSRLSEMTGYDAAELSGQPAYTFLLPPEGRNEMLARNAQRARGVSEKYEHKMLRRDGGWFWAESNAVPFRSETGEIIGTIGIVNDITERRISEAKLRKTEEHLRQAQKMEAIGRLAGGIAHDFNNMLTAINGYSDLILRQLAPDDGLRSKVEEIKKAGRRAATLTYQLLAFSRKQILQSKILNLNEIVSDTGKMMNRLIGEDIDLVYSLEPLLEPIEADPGQMVQVLTNLILNARDAMPMGGRMSIETKNVRLDREFAARHEDVEPGRYVRLAVSDTGIGMDAEVIKQIFEPFFTTKGVGKGTGMGLATVYGIIKQSRGAILVDSERGRGTTFSIYLPQQGRKTDVFEAEGASDANLPLGSETILLVEDEELVRNLTKGILEMCGYRVLEAANGIEALRRCETAEWNFDLLITDVVMPQMGGRDLATRLFERQPHMRVLYMSGYTDDAIVHHGVLDAGTNFIQKPFTPESLAKKIREILDH